MPAETLLQRGSTLINAVAVADIYHKAQLKLTAGPRGGFTKRFRVSPREHHVGAAFTSSCAIASPTAPAAPWTQATLPSSPFAD